MNLAKGKILLVYLFLISSFYHIHSQNNSRSTYSRVSILTGSNSNDIEKKVSDLLAQRLIKKGIKEVAVLTEGIDTIQKNKNELTILLGNPAHHNVMNSLFENLRINKLTKLAPGPEGFLLKSFNLQEQSFLMAAGIDDRGCLYAVGEILRQVSIKGGELKIANNLNIRSAPAFEIRGTQFGQSHVAKKLAHVRDWTAEETQEVVLDYALAGANIFPVREGKMFDFIKSFGLMTEGSFGANTAGANIPEEWIGSESIGRKGYVCLSVPDARAFMLKKCEEEFKNSPSFDFVKFHGGDGGGCECDKCNPYGLKFIKLVEEMAGIIHKYHPDTRIYFTNQKFDNEDDNAIFKYLQEQPRDWLWAWGYGPGSDATTWQPGHRQTHRMDLFEYPGYGPYGLYPKEILHQLPSQHKLLYYNEITHWKYAQHAYIQMYPRADRNGDLPPHWSHEIYNRRPDQFLTMVYNRLTFYAWPEYYHRVFNDLMRYGNGDITHSSGHHDHFNQWMWQRLLWSPRLTVDQVLSQYCKTWFGEEAAPLMAKAILLLEKNIEEQEDVPLDMKTGIDTYYDLVKSAGERIPSEHLKRNWLWRMYMQKGVIDKYVKLDVSQQKRLQKNIEGQVSKLLSGNRKIDIEDIIDQIDQLKETLEMKTLRIEAERLGEESNALFGVRNDGIFNLKHDYIGLGWLKRQLTRASDANKSNYIGLLKMIVDYEDPGEGGYYDNLGTANIAPNVVNGYPYDHGQPYVPKMLSEENRPSQRSMHFTQDEEQGVTLSYRDLDPDASYSIRFTFVRPWYQSRYSDRMNQKSQKIYADEVVLTQNVQLPLKMSEFYNYEIPKSVTKDGELTIRFEKSPDVAVGDNIEIEQWRNSGGWGTIVSEAWLIKN